MPTPHISIDLTTIRLHQSCPPEFNTIQPHEARNLTESITRVDQGIIDEHVEDKPASSVKVGLDGSEEDGFTFESVASRNATIEPEVKAGDQYSYSMPKDLGFALTWETAITFTDMSALRVCYLDDSFSRTDDVKEATILFIIFSSSW